MTRSLLTALFLGLLPTAIDAATGGPAHVRPALETERLEEWPKLSGGAKAEVRKDVSRLRKAKTEEMGEQAHEALIAVGAGAVPYLLPSLGKEDDPEARERITTVLLKITDATHTRVLAEFFEDRSTDVRVWAQRRAAAFPDPELQSVALKLLHEVVGTEDEPPRKEPELEEKRALGLLVTSTGSLEGLDIVFEMARDDWQDSSDALAAALPAVRGPEASAFAVARLGDDRKDTVAALRLLWNCGDESAVPAVGTYLDSEDPSERAAAINALRGIIDKAEPITRLPVFEGIERAKKWKERL